MYYDLYQNGCHKEWINQDYGNSEDRKKQLWSEWGGFIKEITSELYLNEWIKLGQAEKGEKVQGSWFIYSDNFLPLGVETGHHWDLITSFTTKDQLFSHNL